MTVVSAFGEKLESHDGHVSSSRVSSILEFRQISRHETRLYERKAMPLTMLYGRNPLERQVLLV